MTRDEPAEPGPTDVLIAGAGPTGLMLALQLARRGHRPLIIDRHPGPARESRALVVQPRTLELYAHLGLAELALARGARATAASMWADGRRAARVPFGDIGRGLSAFPFLLILSQDENERLLGDALAAQGVEVRWSTELIGLEPSAERVSATLRGPDGSTSTVRAAHVAGCDGARSSVRRLLGIDFVGAPYEQVFFVADTRASGTMTPAEMNVYLWPDGFHLFFPMHGEGHWRVIGILPPELRDRDDVGLDDVLPTLRANVGESLAFEHCSWFSTYRIHHRRAERFRQGRCFLLGDAAHIHSPVGAQGMNTGLQDAYNLAWKLDLVLSGRVTGGAADALLDTYAAEREPVAERLLRTTDQAFRAIVSERGIGRVLRTQVAPRVLSLAMRSERIRRFLFRTISQIGISYRKSPLSKSAADARAERRGPVAGDRFPWVRLAFAPGAPPEDLFARLDDTRFHLLVCGQAASTGMADLSEWGELAGAAGVSNRLAIHVVPRQPDNDRELARAHIASPAFHLLRPDGHIGLTGARLDPAAVRRYLTDVIGLSTV